MRGKGKREPDPADVQRSIAALKVFAVELAKEDHNGVGEKEAQRLAGIYLTRANDQLEDDLED